MSWDCWHSYGYGFRTEGIEEVNFFPFLYKHYGAFSTYKEKAAVDKVLADYARDKEDGNVDYDVIDEICEATDCGCIAEIIGHIMTVETGIRFFASGYSDESEEAVWFLPGYPWESTEKERNLTQQELHDLIVPYAEELGVGPVDYQDLRFSN